MGLGGSRVEEVDEASDVQVLNDCLYIDHATRRQRHSLLAQDALHGLRTSRLAGGVREDLDTLQDALQDRDNADGVSCWQAGCPPVDLARELVSRALDMVKAVGEEPTDVYDKHWEGPNGTDPLTVLFDTDDEADIAGAMVSLAKGVANIVSHEQRVQEVGAPTTIFGDIHGQLRDMLLLFHDFGFPHAHGDNFIFNGDWVDRGKHQIEVVCLVFALKIAFPHKVFLDRGNHEDEGMNESYGFKDQCIERLGEEDGLRAFKATTRAFTFLPLGSRICGKILVVHGGIGDGRWDLEDVEETSNPLTGANQDDERNWIAQNILWSDPIPEDNANGVVKGVHSSPRSGDGVIKTFGHDVTERFLERNDLKLIVRSHEFVEHGHGYELEHQGKLMRVFSARDYQGKSKNGGAIVHVELQDDILYVQPQVLIALGRAQS